MDGRRLTATGWILAWWEAPRTTLEANGVFTLKNLIWSGLLHPSCGYLLMNIRPALMTAALAFGCQILLATPPLRDGLIIQLDFMVTQAHFPLWMDMRKPISGLIEHLWGKV